VVRSSKRDGSLLLNRSPEVKAPADHADPVALVPDGRDLGAQRRGPGQRLRYLTLIFPVMPGWIVHL
jgi:hypothetical protein